MAESSKKEIAGLAKKLRFAIKYNVKLFQELISRIEKSAIIVT